MGQLVAYWLRWLDPTRRTAQSQTLKLGKRTRQVCEHAPNPQSEMEKGFQGRGVLFHFLLFFLFHCVSDGHKCSIAN